MDPAPSSPGRRSKVLGKQGPGDIPVGEWIGSFRLVEDLPMTSNIIASKSQWHS
jgi:hypothetical protein